MFGKSTKTTTLAHFDLKPKEIIEKTIAAFHPNDDKIQQLY